MKDSPAARLSAVGAGARWTLYNDGNTFGKGVQMDTGKKVLETPKRVLKRTGGDLFAYSYSSWCLGHTPIPIISWLRGLARESLDHARNRRATNRNRGQLPR